MHPRVMNLIQQAFGPLRTCSRGNLLSPLISRDLQQDRLYDSIAEMSIVAAHCAGYSTAITILLVQADKLEVEEDYRRTITDY